MEFIINPTTGKHTPREIQPVYNFQVQKLTERTKTIGFWKYQAVKTKVVLRELGIDMV